MKMEFPSRTDETHNRENSDDRLPLLLHSHRITRHYLTYFHHFVTSIPVQLVRLDEKIKFKSICIRKDKQFEELRSKNYGKETKDQLIQLYV